jgi:hypothetical protein
VTLGCSAGDHEWETTARKPTAQGVAEV